MNGPSWLVHDFPQQTQDGELRP